MAVIHSENRHLLARNVGLLAASQRGLSATVSSHYES
jgi:hypothetical protein